MTVNNKILSAGSLLALTVIVSLLAVSFSGCGSGGGSGTATTTTSTTTAPAATTTTAAAGTTTTSTTTTTSPTTTTTLGTGPATFLYSPMELAGISYIIPLGNTNPTGHTLPTDHIYLLFKDVNATYEVVFPVGGQLRSITGGIDYKISVRCSDSFLYYLGHIQAVDPAWQAYIGNNNISGVTVTAGQKAGVTGKNSNSVVAMDLGVIDTDVTRSFINSGNYIDDTLHCGAPLGYYAQPARSSLEALVSRAGASDKDGKIDFDQAGKLIGNWFAAGLTPAPGDTKSNGNAYGSQQIAFVYYNRNATLEVISIGGEITGEGVSAGLYGVQTGATPFENISSSTGLATFELYDINDPSTKKGNLIARYNADDTISVEASSGSLSSFSTAVKTYTR